MDTIAERLKYIRKEYLLNQKQFAEKIGVTNAHISRMEKGITVPSEALTKLICKEFDINTEWLKSGKGPIFESDFNIDEKMEKSVSTFNKLLRSDNSMIKNQASELNLLFTQITNVESFNDDMKILYLNNIINLFSIVNKYTSLLKDDISTGQLTLKDIHDQIFTMYKNDLLNYVDELQRLSFLCQ